MTYRIAVCLTLAILALSPDSWGVEYHRTQVIRTVPLTIILRDSEATRENALHSMQDTFNLARHYFDLWSLANNRGDITRLNHAAGRRELRLDPESIHLLEKALEIKKATEGAFDVLYPSQGGLNREIRIHPRRSSAYLPHRGLKIDVNGIAKGTILDLLGAGLKRSGYTDFLINAGGDILASGSWSICLKEASPESLKCRQKIRVKDRAVMTSGNYERGGHLINPQTGRSEGRIQSATVILPKAQEAGPLAVALFIKPELESSLKKSFPAMRFIQIR